MLDNLYLELRHMLKEDRFQHSIGVQSTAVSLAKIYGADVEKASLAGILHDCAKEFSDDELLEAARAYGIQFDEVYLNKPGLLHGPVGSYIVQEKFRIKDEEIIHSVRFHTTGCENMSLLDKIIYIADFIEPARNFPGVEDLRAAAYDNIDKGVLLALDNTIKYIIGEGLMIDIMTIKARNFLLMRKCHFDF